MVRRGTGLHANQARRQSLEERRNLAAAKLLSDDDLLGRVNAVNLKHVLSDIQTDRGNLHVDGSPDVIRLRRTTLWHLDAGSGRRPPHQKRPTVSQFAGCASRNFPAVSKISKRSSRKTRPASVSANSSLVLNKQLASELARGAQTTCGACEMKIFRNCDKKSQSPERLQILSQLSQ
jgi:hypothetical protein